MSYLRFVLSMCGFVAACTGAALAQESPAPAPPPPAPAASPMSDTMASPAPDASAGPQEVSPASNPGQNGGAQAPTPTKVARPGNSLNGHLPIIDISPESDWADPANTKGSTTSGLPGVVSGSFDLSGTFTLPIYGGFSASYDHIEGSFLNSTFYSVGTAAGGGKVELGSVKRHVDQERIDYAIGKSGLTFEAGLTDNEFVCCLDLPWHTGYAALTYATPAIKALGGLSFVFTEKGSTANHNPNPTEAANTLDIGHKREYGMTQVVTAVVPLSPHFSTTVTYFNGAYDFMNNAPFPYRFNLFNSQANYTFSPIASFFAGWTYVNQFNQGAPFANGNSIRFANFYTGLKFHLDLNKIIGAPAPT